MKYKVFILFYSVFIAWSCDTEKEEIPLEKDRYDFATEKPINHLGTFSIAVLKDKIIFDSKHGNFESPLLDVGGLAAFNFNEIYKIESSQHKIYYFRYGWAHFSNGYTSFTTVKWLKDVPKERDEFVEYEISSVSIDFLQFGSISVCTIGDSQTWFQNAAQLRKKMNQYDEYLIFKGSKCDIFGYPHEGEGGNNSSQLLSRIQNIPKADYYTLLIGTNDEQNPIEDTRTNIIAIISYISSKYPKSKILYLSPVPTTQTERDVFNVALYAMIHKILLEDPQRYQNLLFIDLYGKMRENPQWMDEYLTEDGLHQSKHGIEFMAETLVDAIEKDYNISQHN